MPVTISSTAKITDLRRLSTRRISRRSRSSASAAKRMTPPGTVAWDTNWAVIVQSAFLLANFRKRREPHHLCPIPRPDAPALPARRRSPGLRGNARRGSAVERERQSASGRAYRFRLRFAAGLAVVVGARVDLGLDGLACAWIWLVRAD